MKLELTQEETADLYNKLKLKTNPVWVMLREKIVKKAHKDKVCLYCGQSLPKKTKKSEDNYPYNY